jgi:hypothetical protein
MALYLRTPGARRGRRKGRSNVVAETQKAQNRVLPWRAYQLYVHSGKGTLAAMYLRRVRVVGRAAVGSIKGIEGLYLVSIQVGAASI